MRHTAFHEDVACQLSSVTVTNFYSGEKKSQPFQLTVLM